MPAQAAPKKNRSALKRARQAEARQAKNRSVKKMLRTLSKHVEAAVSEKNQEAAFSALQRAISEIDKAARKGIIHKNNAARKVSRLTRLVNAMSQSEAA